MSHCSLSLGSQSEARVPYRQKWIWPAWASWFLGIPSPFHSQGASQVQCWKANLCRGSMKTQAPFLWWFSPVMEAILATLNVRPWLRMLAPSPLRSTHPLERKTFCFFFQTLDLRASINRHINSYYQELLSEITLTRVTPIVKLVMINNHVCRHCSCHAKLVMIKIR